GAEANHIITSDLVALAADIDASRFAAPCRRIDHGAERHGIEYAVLHRNHRARTAGHQISDGGVAKVARVLGVIRNGRRAAQFVTDGLVDDGHFDAAFFKARLDLAFDLAAEVYLGHAHMALRVAVDVFEFGHFFRAEALRERFGEQNYSVVFAHRAALDDRA